MVKISVKWVLFNLLKFPYPRCSSTAAVLNLGEIVGFQGGDLLWEKKLLWQICDNYY